MLVHDVEQGSDTWLRLRRGIPTASEGSRIVTPGGKPSASQDAYIAELVDEMVRPMEERDPEEQMEQFSGNRHTERGHALEPKFREWLALVTRADVRTVGFVTTDCGRAGCSPDSFIYRDNVLVRGQEIKAPEGKKHALWMLDGGLPEEHKQQVHMSMVVTGIREWGFGSYCPGYKPFHVLVQWDDYTDKLAAALEAFLIRLADAKAKFIDYIPQQEAA